MDGEMRAIVENLQAQQNRLDKRLDSFDTLAKELNSTMSKLTLAVEKMASRQDRTEEKVEEISQAVREMKEKPVKRLDGAFTAFLSALIGALVAAFFALMKMPK